MEHSNADSGLLLIITGCYLAFALQLIKCRVESAYQVNIRGAIAIYSLVAVFVLCAVCGYFSNLFILPLWLDNALHAILAIAAGVLVMSNQAKSISDLLENDSKKQTHEPRN